MTTLRLALLVLLLAVPAQAFGQGESDDEETKAPEEETEAPADAAEGAAEANAEDESAEVAEEAEPSPPSPPQVDLSRSTATLYADAMERFRVADMATAALLYEEVLRREPDHAQARNYLVECFISLGRDDDAAAVRDGATPPGEATAVAAAAPAVAPRLKVDAEAVRAEAAAKRKAKRDRFNPRRMQRGGFGLSLLGPTVGLGLWAEIRPIWLVAFTGGFGGVGFRTDSGSSSSLGGVFAEVRALPIPFRLTPEIGVGLTTLGGPAYWRVDTVARPIWGTTNVRIVGYLLLGVRYDTYKGLYMSAGVGLIPTGRVPAAFTPWPGFRLGVRF